MNTGDVAQQVLDLEVAVERLTRERDEARAALREVAPGVYAAHDFLLRECCECNPEKGIIVDEGAHPTWVQVCDAVAALRGLPEQEDPP